MSADTPRVYGMADDDNHQTPAPEGFRGEAATAPDDAALQHGVAVGAGPVIVQESSGTAFVEATGGGKGRDPDYGDDRLR